MPTAFEKIIGRRIGDDVDLPRRTSLTLARIEPDDTLGADETLESFTSETPSFAANLKRVLRDHSVQKVVVGVAAVACALAGFVVVERMLSKSETVSTPAASATPLADDRAPEAVNPVASNGKDARGRLSPVQAATASAPAAARRPTPAVDRQRPNGNGDRPAIVAQPTARPAARAAAQPQAVAPIETAPTPELPIVVAPDLAVYSEVDRDVQPPKVLSSELPRPTFEAWTTRTNSMELIVSADGTVERVRLLTPPQRMPDMMILSRAKMWKFGPAEKDGRPVRYRLILKWEVNP